MTWGSLFSFGVIFPFFPLALPKYVVVCPSHTRSTLWARSALNTTGVKWSRSYSEEPLLVWQWFVCLSICETACWTMGSSPLRQRGNSLCSSAWNRFHQTIQKPWKGASGSHGCILAIASTPRMRPTGDRRWWLPRPGWRTSWPTALIGSHNRYLRGRKT